MKTINVDGVGEVVIKKSSRAKRLTLSIAPDGSPRATIPAHMPYILAERFIFQHKNWLKDHSKTDETPIFNAGDMVGHYHRLHFKSGSKLSSRVKDEEIVITMPDELQIEDKLVQTEVKRAATRALRRQAEQILPARLYEYAKSYGYQFKEVRCKALKTRWGSCSTDKIINLNIWLMQLPDYLIEYVLIHELAHLNHPHHQTAFWSEVASIVPDYKAKRKELKQYRPALLHHSELP